VLNNLKNPFKKPMEGLQKLSLALLVPILAVFAISVYQLLNTSQSLDEFPSKLTQSSTVSARLKADMDRLDTLAQHLKQSSERHSEILSGVDLRSQSSSDQKSIEAWRSKAGLLRTQLEQDLDLLQQNSTQANPQLKELVLSLTKLLLQENTQWASQQQFLGSRANKAVDAIEREKLYRDFMNEYLATIRALGVSRNAISDYRNNLQTSINGENINFRRISTQAEIYRNSLQHQVILMIVAVVLGTVAICGVCGLRIRRERRSRERRKEDRNVEFERRKVDRG